MDISIHGSFLPRNDPDASLAHILLATADLNAAFARLGASGAESHPAR